MRILAVMVLVGTGCTSPSDGSPIDAILNGPDAAGETTLWVTGGAYGALKLALFANNTGRFQDPCENATLPAVDITWQELGPDAILFTGASQCGSTLNSASSISGAVSEARFTAALATNWTATFSIAGGTL